MNRLYYITLLFVLLIFSLQANGQDTLHGVIVHSDPRLAVLLKKNHTVAPAILPQAATSPIKESYREPSISHHNIVTIYKGKGFRVQIYNGSDRAKAIQIKTEFMRHFPGVHTYLNYVSPSFRVKVGDYRNRSDADGMLREAKSMYTPCMIVPDMVTVTNY